MRRRMKSGAGVVCLTLVLMAVTMAAAAAVPHAGLKSSTPSSKSRLAVVPTVLRLTFTEAPELALARIHLRTAEDKEVSLGPLTLAVKDPATVLAPITGAVSVGLHTVYWEVTGEDGHPIEGKFTFTVTAEAMASRPVAATLPASMDSSMVHHDTVSMPTSATRFDAESGGFVLVRFALYTALLVVIGAVVFRAVVLGLMERRPDVDAGFVADAARRAASIGWLAACVLLVACLARLAAQSVALNGADAMFDTSRLGTLVGATRWGRGWLAQLIATIGALYGFSLARRSGASPATIRLGWTVVGIAAFALAFTPAVASHAAASPRFRSVAMVFDGVHVTGAAGWLGSLVLVLAAGIPAALALREDRRGPVVADLINAFSPTALVFAGLVASTGLFAAWLHIGGFAELWEARYGKLLLAKLAVLSIVALTGAYNWLRVKPTLGTGEGAARVRRSATVEVTIAIIVLAITAVLVATPPPMAPM